MNALIKLRVCILRHGLRLGTVQLARFRALCQAAASTARKGNTTGKTCHGNRLRHGGALNGLSRMRGNHHVRFLGEVVAATPPPYPTRNHW